jgi:transposase
MIDLTRDEHGYLHARLLDVVPGRSGTAYAAWLRAQPNEFLAGFEQAALDPFRGYANAIRDQLPLAVAVLDATWGCVKDLGQILDILYRPGS